MEDILLNKLIEKDQDYKTEIISMKWPHGGYLVWDWDHHKWDHVRDDPKITPKEDWIFENEKYRSNW